MLIKQASKHLYHTNLTQEWNKLCNNFLTGGGSTIRIGPTNRQWIEENTPSSSLSSAIGSETQDDQTLEFPTCTIPAINLVHTNYVSYAIEDNEDQSLVEPWTSNALRLHQSIQQMSALLHRQQLAYSNKYVLITSMCKESGERKNNTEEEEIESEMALLESSVASFVISNLSQIESLRQSLNNQNASGSVPSGDELNFREGVLSNLLAELMTNVAEKFASMQSVRNRKSLELWKDPLRVMYSASLLSNAAGAMVENKDILETDHNDDLMDCSRNMPVFPYEEKGEKGCLKNMWEKDQIFRETYGVINEQGIMEVEDDKTLLQELNASLPSFFIKGKGKYVITPSCGGEILVEGVSSTATEGIKRKMERSNLQKDAMIGQGNDQTYMSASSNQTCNKYNNVNDHHYDDAELDHMEELQRESAQLTISIKNAKLDDVQKVESEMAQIMGLLSQFTSLIAEQQEEIADIHDKTIRSKSNVKSGNEHLIQATERRKANKHYFAKFIIVMALILLFLNWVTP